MESKIQFVYNGKTSQAGKPKEMSWTLSEIDAACEVITESDFQRVKAELLKMKQEQDPEYQKYLELKQKFESA